MGVIEEFKEYAKTQFPKEAVAVIKNGKLITLENKSNVPTENFYVSSDIYDEDITEILHTHTDGNIRPSYDDMKTQIAFGVPMGILAMFYDDDTKDYNFSKVHYIGNLRADYLGLPYIFGINDCYSLVRNYYKTHKNIELMDFPRRWEFWKTENLLINNAKEAGFKEISANEVEVGDVFFCTFHGVSRYPIHMGVLAEKGIMVHHPSNRQPINYSCLSVKEKIDRYLPSITHWMRYVGNEG